MKWVKGCLIGGVAIAAILVNQAVMQQVTMTAAQTVFNRRGYDFSKDVQFSIPELQQYSIEVAQETVRLSDFYRLGIGSVALILVGLILLYGSTAESATRKQFQQWRKAVKKNDSLEIAAIELQVRDESD